MRKKITEFKDNFMKRNILYFVLLFSSFFLNNSNPIFAQTIVIGAGASSGTSANSATGDSGPMYRSTGTSTFIYSRHHYLYTAAELATAGLTPGSVISQLAWNKDNAAAFANPASFEIWLKNSSLTAVSPAPQTWATLTGGATQVYNSPTSLTAAIGWVNFSLTAPFIYTGGALEISVNYDHSTTTSPWSTLGISWKRDNINDRTISYCNSTPGTTLNNNRTVRPQLQITFGPSSVCVNPPNAGASTSSNTVPVCPNSPVNLNLSGNSTGAGLTFEWESSPSNSPFVPTSISSAAPSPGFTINPTATLWYRAKVICNGGTPVYSTPVQVQISTGLAGNTYTINNGAPTTGLNFNSFSDAIAAMQCGILGPITFNVTAGTPYVETINIGNIPGASATNRIRFNGNGALVQFDNTASERQLLTFDGAQYVTIDSIRFKALNATYGWGALITNNATMDSIMRCDFDLTAVTSISSANTNGITFSGSNTSAITSGLNGTYCYVGNNSVRGANGTGGYYYGVAIAAGGNDNNVIVGNTLENYYYYGVYLTTAKNTIIDNNILHKTNKTASITTNYAIHTVNSDISGSKIRGNRIFNPAGTAGSTTVFRGLSLSGNGTATEPVIVANNIMYGINQGGVSSGIYLSAAQYNKVYHNTVSLDATYTGTSAFYGIYTTGANTGTDISNNIVSLTAGNTGSKYGFYYATANGINDAQKNNFYLNSTQTGTQYYGYYTANYATQAAFQTAYPTLEVGSPVENPQFASVALGDFTPGNTALFGTGINLLTDVPRDIINVPRSPAPTPGAYELTSTATNDAGVLEIVSPSGTVCTGTQPVTVRVMNGGINTINNVQIHWTIDGVAQPIVNFTTPIYTLTNPLGNTAVATLGNVNFTTTPIEIKAWTYLPNGANDTINANDSITVTMAASLSGTLTVNSALPTGGNNYQTFTALANDLNTFGICNSVIVNVAPGSGPYVEFVRFNDIPGTSATKTIRINGNGATVQFTNTLAERQLLTLNGTKYMTIDSLTFKSLDPTYGWGALVTAGASNDTIKRCTFDLTSITGTASANSNGIVFSGSNTSATSTGTNGTSCYIGNNRILATNGAGGPYYGFAMAGTNDGNIVVNNEVSNFYIYGMYFSGGATNGLIANNNVHRSTKTTVTTFYGIYLTGSVAGTRVLNNRIHDVADPTVTTTLAVYGLYPGSAAGTATERLLVANNILYNIGNASTLYGLYLTTTSFADVFHNTVNLDKTSSGTGATYGIYASGSSNTSVIRNNNVSITGGTGGIKYGFYFVSATTINDAQRNNYYVNSTQPGAQNYGYWATAYATRAAFQAAQPTQEINSVTVNPQFVAPATGNLTPTNYVLFGNGLDLQSAVPTDIVGTARATMPTPGAYEIPAIGNNNAGSVNLISPSGSFCAGEQPVKVSIVNAGLNNITSLKIHWQINGVNQPVYDYTATLNSITTANGQFIDTVVLGTANFTNGTPNVIKAWTYLPNNTADANNANDTIQVELESSQFTIDAAVDTLCLNGSTTIALTPGVGYTTGNLMWQSSVDATTWTDISNTDAPNYNAAAMTADRYFRVRVTGGIQDCYSDTVKILVADPDVLVVGDSSRCGEGAIVLSAQVSDNAIAKWYDSPTSTTPIATGATFTTPVLTTTTTYYVAADIGSTPSTCRSALQPVVATVNPLPVVDLGNDIFSCVDAGSIVVLDAGIQPNTPSFLWDDGITTSQVRAVDESGQYYVTVTNSFGCATTDTANLTLLQKPVVELGNDTSVCIGTEITLNAGDDGSVYLWSTGSSANTITVDDPGVYNVTVVSEDGCISTDTISVAMAGQRPSIAGIQSNNNGNFTYSFNLVNPQNVVAVEWSFGDGIGFSYDLNPTYTYSAEGVYLVQVRLYSTCGSVIDTLSSNIVSVGKLKVDANELLIFPNPTTGVATLLNKGSFKMEAVTVYNILGQQVYNQKADAADKHALRLSNLASGVYTIQVKTDKGMVVRRLEILK